MNKFFLIIIVCFFFFQESFAQLYTNPIASKKSHPELEITQIEITDSYTIISLIVTNRRTEGGWFCADNNIYIKNSNGTEVYELIKSENIPTCPDQFKFAYSGQTLEFKLYFPPISNKIKFIDLIENCSNACFSFYGIILDNVHNEKIRSFEKGFELYRNGQIKEAIPYFEKVITGDISIESHIYGLSYYYLISVYHDLQNTDKVNYWLQQLLESNIEEKETFIKELDKLDINTKTDK